MFLNSYQVFNFDCGFTHVSNVWPDRNFHDELNGSYCEAIGVPTI